MGPITCNVLVLGESQSGKSTLIEYMRKYANPKAEINTKALGTGFLSHTTEVKTTKIITDLPEYYVSEKKSVHSINYGEYLKTPDKYDYEDLLNTRKGLETHRSKGRLDENVQFNLIDTPGLNATAGDDEAHVQKIFDGLNKAEAIHLLLITISSGPFTQGLKDAIKTYLDMFPGFNGIIAFVHTHFDYKNFHHARSKMSHAISLRTENLRRVMTQTTFPHFKIDCDVYNKNSFDCIALNTIQKILELATFSQHVTFQKTVVQKTCKMRDIDRILRDMFKASSNAIERIFRFKDPEEGDSLTKIFRRETKIQKLEASLKVLTGYLLRHDVNVPEVRYGCHHKKRKINQEQGTYLKSSQLSVLHGKTQVIKSKKCQDEIGSKHQEYKKLEQELLVALQHREIHAKQDRKRIKEVIDSYFEETLLGRYIVNEGLAQVVQIPEQVNSLLRDKAMYAKQTQLHAKSIPTPVHGQHSSPNEPNSLPGAQKYSVLVLGKTQSGKSTFIEHIRKYIDPEYTIDQTRLGDGVYSKTDRTHTVRATTNLPTYEVYNKASSTTMSIFPDEGADEEDIRDLLYIREDNAGLRLAPERSSDAMEFEFLDTPGLCNHEDKDVTQSAEIIDTILSARSFNLILIVVNILDPLTAEQLLALEYYSKVLEGLHSRIAFLYTRADHGTHLFPNKAQKSVLADKTQTLSRIFQGSAMNIEPYPSFTIGLTEKKLPAVQCMKQNTLRDILRLAASSSPVRMDTSSANVDRIKSISHLSEFDYLQRKESLERILGELRPQVVVPVCSPPESDGSALNDINTRLIGSQSGETSMEIVLDAELGSTVNLEPGVQGSAHSAGKTLEVTTKTKRNVLVLGNTQAGKSSMIERLRKFSNPSHIIDRSRLGDGNRSKTDSIERFSIHSNILPCEVFENATGTTHDIRNLGARIDESEFFRLLDGRESDFVTRTALQDADISPSDLVEFCLVDTPGFNDTDHRSVGMSEKIIQEVLATQSFNLILIVVSAESVLTIELRSHLDYYARVLEGLHSNIAFVYTHVDYADGHHSNTKHHASMAMRHIAFSKVFRGVPDCTPAEDVELYNHFAIDLHPRKRPVVQGMLRNTLRDILHLAATNSPVVLDTSQENIQRIMDISHPDKANQVLRGRLRALAAVAPQPSQVEEVGRPLLEEARGRDASPAASMAAVSTDSDDAEDFVSLEGMEADRMDIHGH